MLGFNGKEETLIHFLTNVSQNKKKGLSSHRHLIQRDLNNGKPLALFDF